MFLPCALFGYQVVVVFAGGGGGGGGWPSSSNYRRPEVVVAVVRALLFGVDFRGIDNAEVIILEHLSIRMGVLRAWKKPRFFGIPAGSPIADRMHMHFPPSSFCT